MANGPGDKPCLVHNRNDLGDPLIAVLADEPWDLTGGELHAQVVHALRHLLLTRLLAQRLQHQPGELGVLLGEEAVGSLLGQEVDRRRVQRARAPLGAG